MGFGKGVSGNPSGMPKGCQNKITGQLRVHITDFLEQRFGQVVYDFERLEPKDRIRVYTIYYSMDFQNCNPLRQQ